MSASTMTDLPTELDGADAVAELLGEFHAERAETERAIVEWFERVGSLLSELTAEQEQWHRERSQTEGELTRRASRLEQQEQQIATEWVAAEQAKLADRTGGLDEEQHRRLEQVFERVEHDWAALRESMPGADSQDERWAALMEQLAQTRSELAEARAEIDRLAEPIASVADEAPSRAANEQLQAEMQAMREERVLLESELENVRGRAAQLTEAMDEQRRSTGEQECYWREEFRRQSILVERLTDQLVRGSSAVEAKVSTPPPEPPAAERSRRSGAGDKATLESVRAQFELLQEEAARRRKQSS